MATISSAGIGSGLDVNSIVTQLVAIERQPITALQTKATKLQTQISEFGKQKSALATLRDAASKLTNSDFWSQTVGTSSNPTAVGVTTTTGATAGNYAVTVQSLAAPQALATSVFASSTTAPGAGTLRIELGTWGAGQTSFTPKTGATAVDIAVEATDTLAQVRDKINLANAGVTAQILTDASGSRLMMRSTTTGAESAFRTQATAALGLPPLLGGTDLSALAYDPSTANATQMTRTQTASNAAATFNGLAITATSNTLANVVDGVTLKLGAVTSSPVDISIVQDNETLKKQLQAFAEAYNAVQTLITTQTKYDAASKTGGPLQGDGAAVGLQRQLRNLAGASSGASSTFARLADVGLGTDATGQMVVSATKLDNALANPTEMKKMFANTDLLVPTNNGLGRQMRVLADSFLSVDGSLNSRAEGLRQRLDSNKNQQDKLTDRVAQTEKRLRAQYTALDTQMASLNGLSSYVTQQIAQFNRTS
jgi:flagellar hook-associated protein 2